MGTRLEKLSRRMMALNKAGELSDMDYNTYRILLNMHTGVEETFEADGDMKTMDVSSIINPMCELMEPV